jgi:type II secretory pathway pseudopilin PulG
LRGVLLVEASLTAAILGISLVLITRSLSSGLRALDQARRTEATLAFAQRMLRELELDAESSRRFQAEREAGTQPPSAAGGYQFEWQVSVEPYAGPDELLNPPVTDPLPVARLILTVTERSRRVPVKVSLTTLMLREWVPETWLQGS